MDLVSIVREVPVVSVEEVDFAPKLQGQEGYESLIIVGEVDGVINPRCLPICLNSGKIGTA